MKIIKKGIFSAYVKISDPKEIENLENLKIVTDRYEKVIEKLEIERINKIKRLEELETTINWKKK